MFEPAPQHRHLVSSFDCGWRGVNVLFEQIPRREIPAEELPGHLVAIVRNAFRGGIEVDGKWQSVDYVAGDIMIFPQTEWFPHVSLDREVQLLELFLDPGSIGTLTPSRQLTQQISIRDPLIEQMALALLQAAQTDAADNALYAESMSIGLSAHLMHNYGTAKVTSIRGTLSTQDLRIVREYIDTNLAAPLSIEELSRAVNFSTHHFVTLFRRAIGITPHQYILKMRTERALQLLQQTELPIVEIAHQVGFQTQSHFTRVFRQQTQMTPKQLRDRS